MNIANIATKHTLGANKSYHPKLVGLASASLVLGVPPWHVLDAVDNGNLAWVWDLSPTRGRRDLRFLLYELEGVRFEDVEHVINAVIRYPGMATMPAGRVAEALSVSLRTIGRLGEHNLLCLRHIGRNRVLVDRPSLVGLLRARLVGAGPPPPPIPAPPAGHDSHTHLSVDNH